MVPGKRTGLVALILFAVSLSGCAGEGGTDAQEQEAPKTVTDPTDYGYLDDETSTNQAHIHDYWGGQTEMTVMEVTERWGGTWGGDRLENYVQIRPEDGDIVPQGAGRVDVTVTWEAHEMAMYEDIELFVKTANMTRPDRFVGKLEQGETLTFEVTNADADLPHQVLSAWLYSFTFTRGEMDPMINVDTTITIRMVVHKTLELPLFPAHPDHWENKTELPLLFDRHSSGYAVQNGGPNGYCLLNNETGGESCFYVHVPDENRTVPRYSDHVKVVIEQDNEVGHVELGYHGADQRTFKRPEPESVEGDVWTYILKTGGAETDGPYSRQSLWEFEFYTVGQDGESSPYRGTYTITATVHREA